MGSRSKMNSKDYDGEGDITERPTQHHPKDPRSKAKYNVISRLFFFWLDALFWTGCHRSLDQADLYAHPQEADSEKLLSKFNRYWAQELERKRHGRNARLWMAIFKCIWWRLVIQGLLTITEVAILLGQSLLVGELTGYFSIQEPTDGETREAYLYAVGLVLMTVVFVILHGHAALIGRKLGMMVRISTTAAIYQKTLTLSQVTVGQISVGRVVNLASNDVQKFDNAFLFIQFLWIAPIHLVAFTYLTYLEVQWSAFVATGFIVIQVPLQFCLAMIFTTFRFKSAKVTDKRVNIMNEVLAGIRVIKMYAWENAFMRVVAKLRRRESATIFRGGVVRTAYLGFFYVMSSLVLLAVFATYTSDGSTLTPKKVFTFISLFWTVRGSSMIYVVRGIFYLAESRVGSKRIQKLLELEELSGTAAEVHEYFHMACVKSSGESPTVHKQSGVRVQGLGASWKYDKEKMTLENISFKVSQQFPLLAVIGSVGSGKSTLLQCLLGELKLMEGCVDVSGCQSYSSQVPWVFSGTLRENILFGLPYQKTWYNTVIEACALDKDIAQLIQGDLTVVGERGVTLSGGQKARVNLARAVYHKADTYLLDDPLSAVDTAVGKHLFEKVIRGLLRDKCVVLVTHQLQFAWQADKILAIKDGKVEAYGSHEELVARGVDPTRLFGGRRREKEELAHGDEDDEEEKNGSSGTHNQKTDSELPSAAGKVIVHRDGDPQFSCEPSHDSGSIYSTFSMLSLYSAIEGESSKHEAMEDVDATYELPPEEKAHGSVSMATYYNYFLAGGNYLFLLATVVVFILGEGSAVVSDWWIPDWAECSSFNTTLENKSLRSTCELSRDQRIQIYGGIAGATILINCARTILLYFLCLNAARVLHNRMFMAVLRAPILFFDSNPSGRVLNRFSKDVGFLDELLPHYFTEYLVILLKCIAVIVIASVSNVWILIPAIFVVIIFMSLRWYYLQTSRQVKRLEAIARSPLYSHISATLQGLPTIRTLGKESIAISLFHRYQNEHTKGWYLFLVTGRWFTLRMDVISTAFLAAVAFISLPLASSLNASLVGLALTYAVALTGLLQFCVRMSAEIENLMISAERVIAYSKLESEASLETLPPHQKPPSEWPDQGEIEIADVSLRYSEDFPLVLKSLSLSIRPGEKIGIVGRTGAGKSSLLALLFRMVEPFGVVTIDGINTKEIGLHDLRGKMSIIPQDPVLFSGTLRYNIDPFDEYSDAELWDALEKVQLKADVEELEGQLQGEVSEGGTNFSVGQRQLVCLARALLRRNKILVLDEATANVDIKTDRIIQQAIQEVFSECTVLTIAHRLNTVMDTDRILVLNKGQVKEFDDPYVLLQDPQTQLSKMVEKTGPSTSRKLHQKALEAHLQRKGRSGDGISEGSNKHFKETKV